MGLVWVTALIGRSREEAMPVEFLVDTGSFYSAISPELRSRLGLPPGLPTEVMLADRRIVEAGLTPEEIDGLLIGPSITEMVAMWPAHLGEYLGIHPLYEDVVDLGGASAAGMVWRAAAAIQAGLCNA